MKRKNEKINQHFVPEAYLRGWCDPETPEGQYLWIISKKDRSVSRKSPKNICREIDFYTKFDSQGNRDTQFEDALQKIETRFSQVQHEKIEKNKPLNEKERIIISEFLASMFARVKSQREHQSGIFQETLDGIDKLAPNLKESYVYKLLTDFRDQPTPLAVEVLFQMVIPKFTKMNCTVINNETNLGFITSDKPCCLIDSNPNLPKSWRRPWKEILEAETYSIVFPISPRQLLYLSFSISGEYVVIDKKGVREINRVNKMITFNSDEIIISNKSQYESTWFEDLPNNK